MSLLKWSLAMAGTAMGMRYLSDRHRRRLASGSSLAAQTDRDDERGMGSVTDMGRESDSFSSPPGGTGGLGAGSGSGLDSSTGTRTDTGTDTGLGTGPGYGSGVGSSSSSGVSSVSDDGDLVSPTTTPGGTTPSRF